MKLPRIIYKWRINRLSKKLEINKKQLDYYKQWFYGSLSCSEELEWLIGYISVEIMILEDKLKSVKEKYETTK